MKKALILAAVLLAVSALAFAGPDIHLKQMRYEDESILAPGFGIYWLGTSPWGFMIEQSFVGVEFESAAKGCGECEDGEWRLVFASMWDAQVFYDLQFGGCEPGPCDENKSIRVGVGLGLPAYLGISSKYGVEFGGDEFGLVASLAYVVDWEVVPFRYLRDTQIKYEVYWNWVRNDLGSALSLHMDIFSLGDLIRGRKEAALDI